MDLVEIPKELFPVLRRWREERSGLSYIAASHLIILQEDLPLAETTFVLYHEATHSRLFNCALGFLLGSLRGIEFSIAASGLDLLAEELGEAYLEKHWRLRDGFYSRRPSRAGELPEFSPGSDFLDVCRRTRFQRLARSFLEIRRRAAILVDEWRFPHEGLATMAELSALRNLEALQRDCDVWAEIFELDANTADFHDSITRRVETFVKILARKPISPNELVATRAAGLDPYLDGAAFLHQQLYTAACPLTVFEAVELASQIPYGLLPGLDEEFSQFASVARDACSPTVRLARLASATQAGLLGSKSGMECLPFAVADRDMDRTAAVASQGYYAWERQAVHNSSIVRSVTPKSDENQQLPYGLTGDIFLYNREPAAYGGNVWVIYNERAVFCELDQNLGVLPVPHNERDYEALMKLLKFNFMYQGFERLLENLVARGVIVGDDGQPLGWV